MGRRWRLGAGALLSLIALGLAIVLAFLAGSQEPPSQAAQALLVVLAAMAQGGSAFLFYGHGRADPAHARRSTKRLARLAARAKAAEQQAQAAFEGKVSLVQARATLGMVSVELSWIQEGAVEAYDDWREFHPSVPDLDQVYKELRSDGTGEADESH